MSACLNIDFYRDFELECVCTKCNEELVIGDVDCFRGKINIQVEPCERCGGSSPQSSFFKDLMEFTEKEFGREAARRMELFALTWHGSGIPAESERK